jgi:hypothetical protein
LFFVILVSSIIMMLSFMASKKKVDLSMTDVPMLPNGDEDRVE